jgi:DNA repair photolyase
MESGLRLKYKFLIHDGPLDFSPVTYVKVNFPEVLPKDLAALRNKGEVQIGTTSDAYQPAEKKYRITRQILQVLRDYSFPVSITTKSDLITRDLDLFSEISKKNWCYIEFTIITLDEKLARWIEPGTPSPQRRLEAMKKVSEAGIQTGIWIMPFLPYITDSDENFESIIRAGVENGATFVSGAEVRLREENIERTRLMKFLKRYFPELIPKYKRLYGNRVLPDESYILEKQTKLVDLCKKYKINYLPHFYNRKIALHFYGSGYGRSSKHAQILNYFFIRQLLRNVRCEFPTSDFTTRVLSILGFFPGP